MPCRQIMVGHCRTIDIERLAPDTISLLGLHKYYMPHSEKQQQQQQQPVEQQQLFYLLGDDWFLFSISQSFDTVM